MPSLRLVFSSPGKAAGLAEARRLERWWEEYGASEGGMEIIADPDMPFATELEYLQLGPVGLGRTIGSITRFERNRHMVARDGDDRLTLVVNRSAAPTQRAADSGETWLSAGSAGLFDHSEASAHVCPGGSNVLALIMPRRLLRGALPHAEDAVGRAIPAQSEPLRLLVNYAGAVLDNPRWSDPATLAQAGQHLVDLAVLAIGADRDSSDIANLRGLRAARLTAVLRCIRRDFADPEISAEQVAARVGISSRYLHKLLHETGATFHERLQELRLERALALLMPRDRRAPKISDAAYEAGFGDLSHFNRLFRRRYGMTPTAARGRTPGDP